MQAKPRGNQEKGKKKKKNKTKDDNFKMHLPLLLFKHWKSVITMCIKRTAINGTTTNIYVDRQDVRCVFVEHLFIWSCLTRFKYKKLKLENLVMSLMRHLHAWSCDYGVWCVCGHSDACGSIVNSVMA